MKRNYFSMRAAVTAIGALCGAIVLPSIAYAGGGVTVNGLAVCQSSANMGLTPAGDLSISCTPPGTSNGTTPVCSVSISPASITVGQQSNIQAVCNPAADTYAWGGSGPAPAGGGGFVTFATQGTFTYTVTGTNQFGAGSVSPLNSVLVNPTGGGGGGGACANPKSVTGPFTGSIIRSVAIDRGNSVTFSLPLYPSGKTLEMISSQTTSTQQGLNAEFSVSTCPGDFDTMQAECKAWGGVETSGLQLYAATAPAVLAGTCTVIAGQQYYLNVRNTQFDRVTPACLAATCYMNVHLNVY